MQTEQLKNTHLEEVSNEIDELISYSPHWFIRSGNAIFFIVLIVILSLTWLIKYPDIIIGTARLAAINAPKLVTTRIEGKLEKIKIHNEQIVEKDQPIAFLQSTGSHEDILELEKWINKVELIVLNDDLKIIMKRQIPLLNNLGEIQSAYQEFQNVLRETQETFGNGYYKQKSLALTQDLALLSEVNGNATKQRQLVQNDFELQQIEYKAKESLAKDRIIAPLEFNQDKSKMLSKEQVMEQISAQLIINRITEHNKKKEILDLNKYVSDQKQLFRSALLNLKSRVEDWIQRYIILAPVKGRVFFTSFLQENQLVSIGQNLFYVQPSESQFYAELLVGQSGFGKIKNTQKVMLKVESYPSNEFGYLTGSIGYISNMPGKTDSFLIRVDLPKDLRTNYGKNIFFRNNLFATAEIITDDRRLSDRFIGELNKLFQR